MAQKKRDSKLDQPYKLPEMLLWVFLNTIGVSFGLSILRMGTFLTALSEESSPDFIEWTLYAISVGGISGIVGGSIIGYFQLLALSQTIRQVRRWMWLTVLAFTVGNVYLAITIVVVGGKSSVDVSTSDWLFWWLISLIFGGSVGIAQWAVIRKQFHFALHWLWISAFSWGVSLIIPGLFTWLLVAVDYYSGRESWNLEAISGVVGGGLYSLLTGLALFVILNHPVDRDSDKSST